MPVTATAAALTLGVGLWAETLDGASGLTLRAGLWLGFAVLIVNRRFLHDEEWHRLRAWTWGRGGRPAPADGRHR